MSYGILWHSKAHQTLHAGGLSPEVVQRLFMPLSLALLSPFLVTRYCVGSEGNKYSEHLECRGGKYEPVSRRSAPVRVRPLSFGSWEECRGCVYLISIDRGLHRNNYCNPNRRPQLQSGVEDRTDGTSH